MASEAHFTLTFRGTAVENGEIDVKDLAPALLAMGELLQAANAVVNAGAAEVSVRVKATAQGSFEVDLTLWHDSVDSLMKFAEENQKEIEAANSLLDLVINTGSILGGTVVGLFALLKLLRGRKPERITQTTIGNVEVHIGGNVIVTNADVIKLAEDMTVRKSAKKLAESLENPGIESITARRDAGEEIKIDKSDIPSFGLPDDEELIEEPIRNMTLQIISLSFKEANKWRFTDGGEPFTAGIEDVAFLSKIANRDIVFGKGDYLVCSVREKQTRTAAGLKKVRTIIKVIEHKPAPRQLKLM